MADPKRIPVYDKSGRLTGYRGSGATDNAGAEESKINNAGAGGLGAIAAKNNGTAGSGVSVPAASGGLTEAQKRMAAEEEAESKPKRAPIKPQIKK